MLNKKIKRCLVVALIATLLSQYSGSSIYAISDSVSEDMRYSISSDRFEGNFYLDASRTQYIGSATYSQRGFH